MEMLLRSAECSEETARVRSPKKAFMDDITILTRDQQAMQSVLKKFDDLITWSRMHLKANKSRSLKLSKGRHKQVKFVIAGKRMPIVKEKSVKSLRWWYMVELCWTGVEVLKFRSKQRKAFKKAIDESKLPGKYQIWCLCSLACTLAPIDLRSGFVSSGDY